MALVCRVGEALGLPLDCDNNEWLSDIWDANWSMALLLCIVLSYHSRNHLSRILGWILFLLRQAHYQVQMLLGRMMPWRYSTQLQALQLEMILRKHMPGAYVADLTDHKELRGLFLSQSQPEKERRQLTFLSLPITIRQRIYELVLTDENNFWWDDDQKVLRASISPSLLRISRSVRQQTISTPLSNNKVIIDANPKAQHLSRSPDWYVPASPNGREQLLELLMTLSNPHVSTPLRKSVDAARNKDGKWLVEIREPYLKVWGYDIGVMVRYLRDIFPLLVINYIILIPADLPQPVFKVQHLGRQLYHAISQGLRHPRFKVHFEGIDLWETAARDSSYQGLE
ncbi:uncharacterized protein K452DRAFT_313147 [Aplosporella prunicola CBS 121167]|uniref:Uncharacterized protein n=1 Tax=Aplosporella prunicola CBS 121167 TaxID=1176127 RepID=A0A6A6AWZ6_9PEZI|nr:uncharacterized protein K452DRAFT_313147 [Aplosporella prunicola CBS 121167]KAF2136449.1 hypothetical protein K452DRAFT_313147 [Aplosporella prunicola CBS 121167]